MYSWAMGGFVWKKLVGYITVSFHSNYQLNNYIK
ncbi:hypothetical protein P812_01583 [Serratia marcescens BIDMC 50]|nr:hypothetical protein P812_01583 [Serratia marcescens BIDMC 50]CAI2080639.1 Uncharacterised protein [Serratia marcescens]